MDAPETLDDSSRQILEGVGNEVLFSAAALVAGVVFLICRLNNTATFARDDGLHRQGDRDRSRHNASGTSEPRPSPSGTSESAGRAESEAQRPSSNVRAEHSNDASNSAGSDPDDPAADQQEGTAAGNGGQLIAIEVKALYADSGRESLLSRRVSGTTSILDLKSLLFGDELEERRRVRILFQGRELADHVTMGECDFSRGAVLNAGIGAAASREQEQRRPEQFEIGTLFPYVLTLVCAIGWCFLLLRPDIALTATFTAAIALLTMVTVFAWR